MSLIKIDLNDLSCQPVTLHLAYQGEETSAFCAVQPVIIDGLPEQSDDTQTDHQTDHQNVYAVLLPEYAGRGDVWLTADDSASAIEELLQQHKPNRLLFYVADFKDGRVFSLIRHSRNQGFAGEILVMGDFGDDQAGYFKKSGASGFITNPNRFDILKKTLNDLSVAHKGVSAGALPLFL